MIAKRIILHSVVVSGLKNAMLSCSHLPMMKTDFVREGPGLPSLHSGREHRKIINASCLHRSVSADCLKAFSPEYLARTRDMFDIHKTIVVDFLFPILERRSH